jgi:hypothetical protein
MAIASLADPLTARGISLVRPRRRLSLAPTACHRGRRAQVVSRLAALAATVRLGLYTTEHDGKLNGSGRFFLLLVVVRPRIIDAARPRLEGTKHEGRTGARRDSRF